MRHVYKWFALLLFGVVLSATTVQAQPQELPLGSDLPSQDLSVSLVDGSSTTIGDLTGSAGTVFVFWSNQCPWIDNYKRRIQELHNTFSNQGIAFVAVNANDANAFPKESAAEGQQQNLGFPYAIDTGSQFANALGASRTPHVFVFDANNTLVYVGTIDDSSGDPDNVTKSYLEDALQAVVGGSAVPQGKTKAFGCMIKYYN